MGLVARAGLVVAPARPCAPWWRCRPADIREPSQSAVESGLDGSHDGLQFRARSDQLISVRPSCVVTPHHGAGLAANAQLAARNSRMMFSSASMISSFSTFDFLKLRRKSNDFVGGLKANTKNFGRPGFGLATSLRTA